jgi:hypothetical protein
MPIFLRGLLTSLPCILQMLLVDSKLLGSNLRRVHVIVLILIALIRTQILRQWLALLELVDDECVVGVRHFRRASGKHLVDHGNEMQEIRTQLEDQSAECLESSTL